MGRLMYDSIDPFAIPPDAGMVAGYVDGIFGPEHARFGQPGWDAAGWARFPSAVKVRIAVSASTNDGDVLDVERGDATPAQVPGWIALRRGAGHPRPSYYAARSLRPLVVAALAAAGETADWWEARLDGVATPEGGAVAVQYAGAQQTGHNYDVSAVYDSTWPAQPAGGLMALTDAQQDQLWKDAHAALSILLLGQVQEPDGTVLQADAGWIGQRLAIMQAGGEAAKAELEALTALVQGLGSVPPADLKPVLDSLARLSVHLGVGAA